MQILICKYDNLKLEYKELKILIKYVVKEEIRQWGYLEYINMLYYSVGGGGGVLIIIVVLNIVVIFFLVLFN